MEIDQKIPVKLDWASNITAESNADVKNSRKPLVFKTKLDDLPAGVYVAPQTWRTSLGNRFAIRAITRGVFGALGYAWGFQNGSKFFKGYSYDFDKGAGENWTKLSNNTHVNTSSITGIARGIVQTGGYVIDTVFGGGMHSLGKKFDPDGNSWAMFRNTSPRFQRSLSKEIWGVTFDFAMSSTGDALADEVINIFDPNHNTSWLKDGKIHWTKPLENRIDIKKLGKSIAKRSWHIFSYRQGEDWAVAPFYVYACRLAAKFQNERKPGFVSDFDSINRNGASLQVDYQKDIDGSIKPENIQVTGDYTRAGAENLWMRFWLYNDLTRKYRETYNSLGLADPLEATKNLARGAQNWANTGFAPPSASSVVDKVRESMRWAVGESIKSAINMIPSAAVFSAFRVQQRRDEGFVINGNEGSLYKVQQKVKGLEQGKVYSEKTIRNALGKEKNGKQNFKKFYKSISKGKIMPYRIPEMLYDKKGLKINYSNLTDQAKRKHEIASFDFSKLSPDMGVSLGSSIMDGSGKFMYEMHKGLAKALNRVPEPILNGLKIKPEGLAREWVHAGSSYFPYFFAKSDWIGPMAYSEKVDNWIDNNILTPVFGESSTKDRADLRKATNKADSIIEPKAESAIVKRARNQIVTVGHKPVAANAADEKSFTDLANGYNAMQSLKQRKAGNFAESLELQAAEAEKKQTMKS